MMVCHLFETFHAGFHTPDEQMRALRVVAHCVELGGFKTCRTEGREETQHCVLFLILYAHKLK